MPSYGSVGDLRPAAGPVFSARGRRWAVSLGSLLLGAGLLVASRSRAPTTLGSTLLAKNDDDDGGADTKTHTVWCRSHPSKCVETADDDDDDAAGAVLGDDGASGDDAAGDDDQATSTKHKWWLYGRNGTSGGRNASVYHRWWLQNHSNATAANTVGAHARPTLHPTTRSPAPTTAAPTARPTPLMNMRPIPSSAPTAPPPTVPPPTPAPSAASNATTNSSAGPSADPDEIFMLLNGTIGAWLECYVEHALCDISSCTRNADGYSASCGCIRRSNADAATLALGWPSSVLATDGTYIATLHDYFNRSDEADGTAMCTAIAGGSVWPDADLVSLWSENPYVSDDQINSDETTCDAAEGSYGANCMGAPCYDVPYNSTPNVFNVTCVCPVKEFSSLSVSSVRDDVCKTASANTSCAVVTGQYWRYKEYTKMTEAIAKVSSAAADPKPNECRNDCDECDVRDGDDDDDEVPLDELQYYYYSTGYKVPADDHTPDNSTAADDAADDADDDAATNATSVGQAPEDDQYYLQDQTGPRGDTSPSGPAPSGPTVKTHPSLGRAKFSVR